MKMRALPLSAGLLVPLLLTLSPSAAAVSGSTTVTVATDGGTWTSGTTTVDDTLTAFTVSGYGIVLDTVTDTISSIKDPNNCRYAISIGGAGGELNCTVPYQQMWFNRPSASMVCLPGCTTGTVATSYLAGYAEAPRVYDAVRFTFSLFRNSNGIEYDGATTRCEPAATLPLACVYPGHTNSVNVPCPATYSARGTVNTSGWSNVVEVQVSC